MLGSHLTLNRSLATSYIASAAATSTASPPHLRIPTNKKQSRHTHVDQVIKIISVVVFYEQGVGLKSSITVDTASRKELTLQGCTNYPLQGSARTPDTSQTYLLFQTLLLLFCPHSCMIWTKLTRNDAVFSRASSDVLYCAGFLIFRYAGKIPKSK